MRQWYSYNGIEMEEKKTFKKLTYHRKIFLPSRLFLLFQSSIVANNAKQWSKLCAKYARLGSNNVAFVMFLNWISNQISTVQERRSKDNFDLKPFCFTYCMLLVFLLEPLYLLPFKRAIISPLFVFTNGSELEWREACKNLIKFCHCRL